MARRTQIHDGQTKIIYEGIEPGTVIQYFKDDIQIPETKETKTVNGKGVLNNRISAHLMTKLETIGVPTHFIRSLNMREQVVREVEPISIEIVMRNLANKEMAERLGLTEGTVLPRPVIEFYYKDKKLGNPMVNDDHMIAFGWVDPYELEEMVSMSYRANDFISGVFAGLEMQLVDITLEFGRIFGEHGELYLVLSNEITPDNCTLWDTKSGQKFDRDVLVKDDTALVEAYEEIAYRLGLIPKKDASHKGGFNEQLFENLETIENELSRHRKLKDIKKIKPSKI